MGLIPLKDYAALHERDPVIVRQKVLRDGFETARKVGRDWFIDSEEPYTDRRMKTSARGKGDADRLGAELGRIDKAIRYFERLDVEPGDDDEVRITALAALYEKRGRLAHGDAETKE